MTGTTSRSTLHELTSVRTVSCFPLRLMLKQAIVASSMGHHHHRRCFDHRDQRRARQNHRRPRTDRTKDQSVRFCGTHAMNGPRADIIHLQIAWRFPYPNCHIDRHVVPAPLRRGDHSLALRCDMGFGRRLRYRGSGHSPRRDCELLVRILRLTSPSWGQNC